jgi:hypothetical protein
MNNIHIMMMGKGGVGKSTCSVILAQYLVTKDPDLRCADLDPTNATFNAFEALNAEHINIADRDFNVDPAEFDKLMEKVLTDKCNWVIDTGAATFLPLMNYFIQNDVFSFLLESERQVIIHTPLVGGPAMEETIRGLKSILELCAVPVVVWENEFFGHVSKNGKSFVQSPGYEQFKARVLGVVRLAKGDPKQSEKDMVAMNSRRLTWDQAASDPNFLLMSRQRLTKMRRDIEKELDRIEL